MSDEPDEDRITAQVPDEDYTTPQVQVPEVPKQVQNILAERAEFTENVMVDLLSGHIIETRNQFKETGPDRALVLAYDKHKTPQLPSRETSHWVFIKAMEHSKR